MARLAGLEPAAYGLEVRCSIQLSYRRMVPNGMAISIAWRGLSIKIAAACLPDINVSIS